MNVYVFTVFFVQCYHFIIVINHIELAGMRTSNKKKRLIEAGKKGAEQRKNFFENRRDQDSAELDVAFDDAVQPIGDVFPVDSEDVEEPPAVPQMAPKDVVKQQRRFAQTIKRTKRKTVYACRSMKAHAAKSTRRWKENRRRAIEIEEEEERPHSAPPILPSDCPMDLDLPPPRPASADFIKKPPLRTITDPEKASKRTLRRRKADIQKLIQKTLPNQYELRPSSQQNSGLNATDVLEFVANNNCSFNLVRQISKKGKGPSVRQVYKKKDEVLKEMPANTTRMFGPDGEQVPVTTSSLIESLEHMLSSQSVLQQLPPGPIKVTVSGDAGGDKDTNSTKIGFFLNSLEKGVRTDNIHLLASYYGPDTRSHLVDIFDELYDEMAELANGIETADGHRDVLLYLVADFKFLYAILGLQNAVAKFPCPFCLITKEDLKYGTDALERTFDHMNLHGEAVEALGKQATALDKQKHFSMNGRPLIPPNVILVPPPLHTLSGVINKLISQAMHDEKQLLADIFDFLSVEEKHPAHELTGRDGAKVVNYIAKERLEAFPNFEFFLAMSRILPFCQNKMYTDSEIDQMEDEIKSFMKLVREQPDFTITPKLHCLEKHVVPFMRRQKSWSSFSEQGFEGIHHSFNLRYKRTPKVKPNSKQAVLQSFAEHQTLKNFFSMNK